MEQSSYTSPVTQTPPPPKGSAGPIIGTIIVIVLLAFGGLYFWGALLNEREQEELPYIPGDESGSDETPAPQSLEL